MFLALAERPSDLADQVAHGMDDETRRVSRGFCDAGAGMTGPGDQTFGGGEKREYSYSSPPPLVLAHTSAPRGFLHSVCVGMFADRSEHARSRLRSASVR